MTYEHLPRAGGQNENGISAAQGKFIESDYRGDLDEKALNFIGKDLQRVQARISELEADLEKGTELVGSKKNPELRKLGVNLGRDIVEKLKPLYVEKKEIEERIQEAGGKPSDYTVQ
jgi:hypothetical protein